MRYSLQESLLKITIKSSFTENFSPLQTFSSGEMDNFCSSVMGCCFFWRGGGVEKVKNKALMNGGFFRESALYRKSVAIIINSCI